MPIDVDGVVQSGQVQESTRYLPTYRLTPATNLVLVFFQKASH